jgi:hypothetical protein
MPVGRDSHADATLEIVDAASQRRWMEQWRAASAALEAQRKGELRSLTAERALAASEALLSLASPAGLGRERRVTSGLVELQRLLHGRRRL